MGVHGSGVPQSLIKPRPDYSGPRCSRSAEHPSPVPANKQSIDRPARAGPGEYIFFLPPCGGKARMGVHGSGVPQSLIKPRPDYSGPRCSRSAESASLVTGDKRFVVHRARFDPDAGRHRVQLQVFVQYRRSRQCRSLLDVGGGTGMHLLACCGWPATAGAQHRSCRCEASVPGRL